MNGTEILNERYELVTDRLREIRGEHFGSEALDNYFSRCADFLLTIADERVFLARGGLQNAALEELQRRNHQLYADILPAHYGESYANPFYASARLGEEYGRELCFLYTELRSLIGFAYEGRLEELVIRMELFVEVCTAFAYGAEEGQLPSGENIRKILYWFVNDYAEDAALRRIREQFSPEDCFAVRILMDSDLSDARYLYAYGEYVGDSDLETAAFLAGLPEETIAAMADTFTEGYRMGFEVTNKDLSRKTSAGLYYHIGFGRMVRRTVENLSKLGLKAVAFRSACSVLDGRGMGKIGFHGSSPNRQYDYDHKDDQALFLDRSYMSRKLEANRAAYEKYKKEAAGYAGPAVLETFGEADFRPAAKKAAYRLTEEQNRIWVEYRSRAGELQREYIPEEERSFTCIAFPIPEIGPVFRELFEETIRINTLDYMLYRRVQQNLIDVLDTADYCEIKGAGGNRTNLKGNLYKLGNPEKETIFENCVADVNIPVGEVFTSPVLEGTNGVLHVTHAFLAGLEYKNLVITFENGMVRDYDCDNFPSGEENRRFIYENIMARHETLPLGEFAIGTNTTAYAAARRLGVEAKLPVLIAEKMGPHFAVGDTCYSHSEEVRVYNPDGREIVAKSNAVADLRDTRPLEAYFNCHTDITIPYDELGELTAVRRDGSRITVIRDGRFVLPGCEELNKPLEEACFLK